MSDSDKQRVRRRQGLSGAAAANENLWLLALCVCVLRTCCASSASVLSHILHLGHLNVCVLCPRSGCPSAPEPPKRNSMHICIAFASVVFWWVGVHTAAIPLSIVRACVRADSNSFTSARILPLPCVPHARKIAIPSHYLVVVGWLVAYLLTREVCEPDRPTDRTATGCDRFDPSPDIILKQ